MTRSADRSRSPVRRGGDLADSNGAREALRLKDCAWVVDQVKDIFRASPRRAQIYAEGFARERIDGEVLVYGLTEAELRDSLGMEPLGHRRKLSSRIEAWLRNGPPEPASRATTGGPTPHSRTPTQELLAATQPSPAQLQMPQGAPQAAQGLSAQGPKPGNTPSESQSEPLEIFVRACHLPESEQQVMFKVKQSTMLGRVFAAACMKLQVDVEQKAVFIFNSKHIGEAQTPGSLGMVHGDTIEMRILPETNIPLRPLPF